MKKPKKTPKPKKPVTDTDRLDWLEKCAYGGGVIGDDNGRWAVPDSGFQNLSDAEGNLITDRAIDVQSTFVVEADEWKPTIREAIDAAMKSWERGGK